MESKPAIQMVDFGLKELRVQWHNPLAEGQESPRKIDVGYEVQTMATPGMIRIEMTFSDLDADPGTKKHFNLFVRVLGFFKLETDLSREERSRLIYSNGLAMLFSSLRGVLLPVSGCFPPDFRYIVPTVNLQEIVQEVEAKRKALAPVSNPPRVSEPEPAPAKRVSTTGTKKAKKR